MNNARRKEILAVAARLADLVSELESVRSDLETIRDEEQDYLDVMPESFQNGDKGQVSQSAIDNLEQAIDCVNDLIDNDPAATLESAAE
jgi:flagellar biosynthesis chaperone FliJ